MNEEKKIQILKMEDVLPNRFQPRIKFDDTAIHELAQSIKEHGVIQPIVVRPLGDKFEIIAGERRYKASSMAGKQTIPVIVTDLNDKESAEVALIENVQRQNLTPIEEAISYRKILDMGYLTQEQLAEKLGKSQSSIANKLRLLNLHDDVQEALLEGSISERHARSLLKLDSMEDQKNMLGKIIKERLTVRKADEEIDKLKNMSTEEKENMFQKDASDEIQFLNLEDTNEPKENMERISIPEINIQEDVKDTVENSIPEPVSTWNMTKKEEPIGLEPLEIKQSENTINPGFMDIDRIAEEAKDIPIFKPTDSTVSKEELDIPKENVPMETNVSPSVQPSIQPISQPNDNLENTPVEEKKEEIESFIPNGISQESKFFNFGIPSTPSSIEEPTEKRPNNEFNFDFDSFFNQNNTVDKKEETIEIEESSSETPSNTWIFPPNNQNLFESPESTSAPTPTPSIFEQTISDAPNTNLSEEPLVEKNEIEEKEEIPSAPTYSIPDFIEKLETPEMELNNHIIEKDSMPLESEDYDIRVVTQFDIKRVTNKLRDFVKELENMGYKVDTDEIDFENFYQINIKIDK